MRAAAERNCVARDALFFQSHAEHHIFDTRPTAASAATGRRSRRSTSMGSSWCAASQRVRASLWRA